MQPIPDSGLPPASSSAQAPRRRRSESDRKKHAGWRRCPRCNRSVSTNGRNFYHHMHKCDRVFFAHLLAQVDYTRSSRTTPASRTARSHTARPSSAPSLTSLSVPPSQSNFTPHPPSPSHSRPFSFSHLHPLGNRSLSSVYPPPLPATNHLSLNRPMQLAALSPPISTLQGDVTEPPKSVIASPLSPINENCRVKLSDMQRVVFLQQLCFLRVYDRTVDQACSRLEAAAGSINLIGRAVFDAVRRAKASQSPQASPRQSIHSAPHSPSSPLSNIPMPLQAVGDLPQSRQYSSQPIASRSASAMAISSVIND